MSTGASSPSHPPARGISTVPALLAALTARGGAPALTWYDDDGRVELSGAVLANWVVKTTNLLVEELDAAPGTRVRLDLPAHWRAAVWALAAWRAGATVLLGDPDGDAADVVVTDRPGAPHAAAGSAARAEVVAVSLPALARRFDGDLPPGAIDAAAAVMTYADALGWVPPTDPAAPALSDVSPRGATDGPDPGVTTHAALLGWATADDAPASGTAAGARTVLVVPHGVDARPLVGSLLRAVVGVWARGGSAVVVTGAPAAAEQDDPERWRRIVDGERAEATLRLGR
ncbi:TIGR03089 family protein [Luteimicrobium subarcticum]|uniref:Uncharacterized protein (TIGR03089 family) n=1 Tax=Luteimicrobium subarcticum TaxID=620910 RepID=A0A2M8WTL9_9MICO|nr:TIGR03089 family protein [Luteimicrobium subarcticum]PJI94238.1 uncharacterized protein (TIGR03089 family) [Luteimicrobium subarcticum]